MRFADLDLILEGTAESCRVTAISSAGNIAGQANLSVARYLATQDNHHSLDAVEAIGRALFQALPEDVRRQINQKPQQTDLRIRLDIPSAELSSLPWEYLHDGATFLALTPDVVLQRHIAGPDTPSIEGDLRVLVAIPAHDGGPEAREAEKALVRKALGQQSDVQLDFLDERAGAVTLATIQRELRRSRTAGAPYHVLHLACPLQDDDKRTASLVLEDETGHRILASIDQLKWCAADHPLQLVLFSATEGTTPVAAAASIPAAAELAQLCAGAVCVPRFPPRPGAMELFAGEVYLAIADGYPIDAAITEGRRATLREAGEGTTDWAAPVVFVRGAPFALPGLSIQPTFTSTALAEQAAIEPVSERATTESASAEPGPAMAIANGDQSNRWSQLPLELWIAILGAATTILVALIPVGVELFRSVPADKPTEVVASSAPAPTPSLAAYDFGALVAYFDVPENGGVDPAEADLLIDRFYLQLENELGASMDPLRFRAGLLGPEVVGRVTGATADEREQNAAQLARSFDADMVLYGVVSYNDITRQLELQPEYYIAPESFSDALEMTGAFRFGNRIGVSTPLNRGLGVERELSARATSLAQVIVGLSLYLLERDYAGALTAFETAAQTGWESTEGREVLGILIGNTHLSMAADAAEQCDQTKAMAHVDEALRSYRTAAELAPAYARAYTGEAAAYYLAAQWADERNDGCADRIVDVQTLEQMFQAIDLANQASEQPKEIGVRSRILLTEAQAHFLNWLIADPTTVIADSPDQLPFWPITDKILNNYEDGDQPSVASVASYARVLRGQTLALMDDCWGAEDEYDGALAITETDPVRRMEIWEHKGFCYEQLNQPTAASEAYNQALQIARALGDDEAVIYFETARRLQDGTDEP